MRGFIKACGGGFVILGLVVMVLFAAGGLVAATGGGLSAEAGLGALGLGVGVLAAVAGFFTGAAIALVGGAAYMLAVIDERLEAQIRRINRGPEAAPEPIPAADQPGYGQI